ncbi:DNA-binding IclR family transcriptional regulator [Agromyces flavus]|uniref:DNA-binding IclR family transcriptional regulator n=1 Tax=Agromyces flavus TaxID=589382 RepID=A0A1H1ZSJ0_9MICO|nr:IclR family transcriptional regulator [Agromyces flavus]MCP2367240.1 DNA-binding IclR family transcriptional regulator [Agromyces flavus]GGI46122.1 IclR family transcriptional regulator [Agromyces flavus]SDT36557.1 DNA-binding transcriptional regulator, IclR family [Agromyces flavus]
MRSETSKVPAADQALRILAHLAAQRGPVPAASIAQALGLPRSTTYQLLTVMQDRGFVVHLPEERRYGLGVAAFELSSGFSRQQPLTRLGRPLVAGIVDRLAESGHLAVLHGRDVLYLVEERAPRRPSLVSDVGVRLPAHLTASGRAMLAELPPAQLRALYPDRDAFSERHPAAVDEAPWTYSRLKAVLAETRSAGVATEHGEVTEGLASVGAAVLDHLGWPAAAIAVTFAEGSPPELVATASDAVRDAATTLSRRIRGAR